MIATVVWVVDFSELVVTHGSVTGCGVRDISWNLAILRPWRFVECARFIGSRLSPDKFVLTVAEETSAWRVR